MSISPDGGANYLLARFYFPRGFRGTSVYADGDTLYAGTDLSGLAISTDLGPTYNFNRVSYLNGLGSNVVEGVYADGGTVYAATRGGVSISTDGGRTSPTTPPPTWGATSCGACTPAVGRCTPQPKGA